MADKVTISSSSVDRHGDCLGEILQEAVTVINGPSKMRMLVNHRRDLPPIGYWENAELASVYDSNINVAKAEEKFYSDRETLSWDSNLIQVRPERVIALINRNQIVQSLTISVDKNNLRSYEDHEKLGNEIKTVSIEEVDFQMHSRKHALADPELIIKLTPALLVYHLFHPFFKKMGEKIAEEFAEDVYKFSKQKLKEFQRYIFKVIRITRNKSIPYDKTLTTIFEVPGKPYIELYAKTDNADMIAKALSERKIKLVHDEIQRLSNFLTIEEIHFSLNEKGSWKFSYLVTNEGNVIGAKKSFDERDKLHKKILLSPTAGYSMGGGNVKYEKIENEK